MKKVISFVLLLAIASSFIPTAYADKLQESIEPQVISNGKYMYYDEGQQYEMYRADITLCNIEELEQLFLVADLGEETKNDLREYSLIAAETGDTTATATIFYPATFLRTTETSYTSYKNREFKVELIYYKNMSTEFTKIVSGMNAYEIASELTRFTVDVADSQVPIPIFSSVISLLDLYENITGSTPIIGSYNDYVMVRVNYDIYNKHTYIKSTGTQPTWMHGAYTRKVYLKNMEVTQYYFNSNGGRKVDYTSIYNQYFETPHFGDAVPTVYDRAQFNLQTNQLSEDLGLYINNQKIVF